MGVWNRLVGTTLLVCVVAAVAACAVRPAEPVTQLAEDPPCPTAEALAPVTGSGYGRTFMQHYAAQVYYPSESLDAGQTGDVVMCVKVNRKGHVLHARISGSSGYPMLDGAALYSLGTLDARDPQPVPADLAPGQDALWLSLPVHFAPPGRAPGTTASAPEPPCTSPAPTTLVLEKGTPLLRQYSRELTVALLQHLRYPEDARADLALGGAEECVTVARDGRVLNLSILRSSGSPLLDSALLRAAALVQFDPQAPRVSEAEAVAPQYQAIVLCMETSWSR